MNHLRALLCFSVLPLWLAAAPIEVSSTVGPVREYHLFAGVDLFLRHDGEIKPVEQLDGRFTVLADEAGGSLQVINRSSYIQKRIAKLSNISVEIDSLKSRPVFSLANDPSRQSMLSQTAIADYLSSQVDRIETAERQAADNARFSANAAIDTEGGGGGGNENPTSSGGAATTSDPSMELGDLAGDMGADFFEDQIDRAQAEGNFDALRITFMASSAIPLANTYAVICARVRVDGELVDLNFHQQIGAIGPGPRKIDIERSELPPGYELIDTRIHLFNHGEEIATNLSERRIDLTAADAREYVKLDHQGQNKGESRPAEPVWEIAPLALAEGQSARDFDFPVTVEINSTGEVLDIAAGDGILPDHIATLIQEMTFVPALENGAPVSSFLNFNLADYFR